MIVEQTCLDFANPRRFNGEGHMHVGNLAVEIYYKEGLDNYIKKVPFDQHCRHCNGTGRVTVSNNQYDDEGLDWGAPKEDCPNCKGKGKVQDIYKLRDAEFTWLSHKIEAFVKHSCDIKPEYSGQYYYTPKPK
jgi:hypothetical protein